ncbi:hypothetical protein LTR47_007564 [Exophiala xenobiotica]|nr:hypothetical protein LTR72_004928 [Exophiala xenobiotica]KAK5230422.1 hypothetical protein LTR47_007564 [Exophiala xenobiotica]KAK5246679.1 hypothetical protein LTS06_008091 [Exophiala xenobiotica]KAK5286372.1 hypothetical protein LTR14_010040 [Exophiala xenobiotica]KAK5346222.1 hypothetical protein LTR61_010088 [Exophiala xenobiotica]
MATFDFERLDAELYNLDDTDGAIEFQDMVEDFMNVAKTNPAVLEGKDEDVAHFCAIVADDEAWPLAQLVVPEFCVTQDQIFDGNTPVNIILDSLKHKMPPPITMEDPGLDCDNDLWDRMLQAGMLYAPTKGRGVPPTILEEPEPADDLVENVIGNTSNFRFHCAGTLLTHTLDTTHACAITRDDQTRGLQVNVRKDEHTWNSSTKRSEPPKPVLATTADCPESEGTVI